MQSRIALAKGSAEALIWSSGWLGLPVNREIKNCVLKWTVWIWTLTACSHLRIIRQKENISSLHPAASADAVGQISPAFASYFRKVKKWNFLMTLLFHCFSLLSLLSLSPLSFIPCHHCSHILLQKFSMRTFIYFFLNY